MTTSHSPSSRWLSQLLRALRPSMWPFIAVGALLLYRIWQALSGFAASHYDDARAGWLIIPFQALAALKPFLMYGISSFLVITAHEAGHLVAGWAVGFRFHAVRVRRLHLERHGRSLRLRWIWMPDTPRRIGGFARMSPCESHNLRPRLAVLCAGGPVASLLFALALLVPAYQLQLLDALPEPDATHSVLILWLALTGLLSLLGFLFNLVPWTHGGWQSDGAALLALGRGGPQADLHCLAYEIQGLVEGPVLIRDWPEELLTRLIHLQAWNRSLLAHAWNSLIDRGRDNEAGWLGVRLLDRSADLPPELHRDLCDAAALLLAAHGEAPAAAAFLARSAALGAADAPLHRKAQAAVDRAERGSGEPAEQTDVSVAPANSDSAADVWIERLAALAGKPVTVRSRVAAGPMDRASTPPAPEVDSGTPASSTGSDQAPPQRPARMAPMQRTVLKRAGASLSIALALGAAACWRYARQAATSTAARSEWRSDRLAMQFYDFGVQWAKGDAYLEDQVPALRARYTAYMNQLPPRATFRDAIPRGGTPEKTCRTLSVFLGADSYLPEIRQARARYPQMAEARRLYYLLQSSPPWRQSRCSEGFQAGLERGLSELHRQEEQRMANEREQEKRRLLAHRHLTRQLLAHTPDDDLEQVVLDYAADKIGDHGDREYEIVSRLPKPVQMVYAIQTLQGEIDDDGLEEFSDWEFVPLAAKGYRLVGAVEHPALAERAAVVQRTEKPKEETGAASTAPDRDNKTMDALDDELDAAERSEDVDRLIAAYIRAHPGQFVSDRRGTSDRGCTPRSAGSVGIGRPRT